MPQNYNARCHVNNELCVPRYGGLIKKGIYTGLGFCSFHYGRAYRESDKLFDLEFGKGKYARSSRRTEEICSVPGCEQFCMPTTTICPKHHKKAWRYKITDEEYARASSAPICSNTECKNTGPVVMDHDHSCCPTVPTCGKCNRGWLCIPCNVALGMVQDNPRVIQGLSDYLARSKR